MIHCICIETHMYTCTVHGCLCTGGAEGVGAVFTAPELEGWEWLTTVHGELPPLPPLLLLLLLLLPPPFSFFFFLSLVSVCLAKVALNALPTISLSSLAWMCVCVCVHQGGIYTHKSSTHVCTLHHQCLVCITPDLYRYI